MRSYRGNVKLCLQIFAEFSLSEKLAKLENMYSNNTAQQNVSGKATTWESSKEAVKESPHKLKLKGFSIKQSNDNDQFYKLREIHGRT